MQDVADYLVCREGLWWSKEGNYLLFHDGDDEPCFRDEGPPFRSFVDTNIYEVSLKYFAQYEILVSTNVALNTHPL